MYILLEHWNLRSNVQYNLKSWIKAKVLFHNMMQSQKNFCTSAKGADSMQLRRHVKKNNLYFICVILQLQKH